MIVFDSICARLQLRRLHLILHLRLFRRDVSLAQQQQHGRFQRDDLPRFVHRRTTAGSHHAAATSADATATTTVAATNLVVVEFFVGINGASHRRLLIGRRCSANGSRVRSALRGPATQNAQSATFRCKHHLVLFLLSSSLLL